MSEWRHLHWGDISRLAYGRSLTGYRDRVPTRVRVYGTNGPIGYTDLAMASGPGVVVGRKGAYRGVHYSTDDFFVIDTAYYLQPLEEMDLRWAYYALLTQDINGLDSGSAIPSTTRESFYSLRVAVPPLAEQRAIACVLGALDDKIESNRRIVASCVDLARAVLSDGGASQRVGDSIEIAKGLSYKGAGLSDSSDDTPMFNLGNFGPSGWLDRTATKYYKGDFKEKHTVRTGDLIVANTDLTQQRVILGRPALVPPTPGPAIITHHVFAVRCSDSRVRLAIWAQLNGRAFRERAEGYATGTTVASLPADALSDFVIQVPSEACAGEAESLIERAWQSEAESEILSATRDVLLPELLSGRMRAVDAETLHREAL